MMELWRYMYKYEGRWYEAYAYLLLGTTPEVAHQKIMGTMAPEVSGLRVRSVGHVTSVGGCGPAKRVPKSYVGLYWHDAGIKAYGSSNLD